MPALVNYSGSDQLCYSTDSAMFCSTRSLVDVYFPPCKKARVSSSYASSGSVFEEDRRSSIDSLPEECVFEIFRRLPGQSRSASACVSKRWLLILSSLRNSEMCKSNYSSNDVVMVSGNGDLELESDGYLTRCLEGNKATDVRLAAIAVGTASRGGLGKLSIRGSNTTRGITDFGLAAISHGCPSLKALSLWNVPSIGDKGLIKISEECHSLEKLDLCHCPMISNKGLMAIAENSPNLTALSIESCRNIGNDSLQAIARFCPKLQSVSIKGCASVGDQGVTSILSSPSSVLEKVKLQDLTLTDVSLAVVGLYGKSITSLVLTGLQNVSEKGFWVMGKSQGLKSLASLTITGCRGTTDVSLEAIGVGCPNLKQMCLRKCCFVSDAGLVAFGKAAGSLESLHLEECNRITQAGVLVALSNCGSKLKSVALAKCMGIKDLPTETQFLAPCESLRNLSIRNCPGFGNSSLAIVGKLCPRLHNVDLSGLGGITGAGLLPLIEHCEAGLVKVNLSGCSNLTDTVISSLVRLHGGTIKSLNLEGCNKLTDASLMAIADSCLVIDDLNVSKCSITDSGVAWLASAEHLNLRVLSLAGCAKVSNNSAAALRKLGRTLVGLNLQKCNSINNSTVELLVGSLWRCDILS